MAKNAYDSTVIRQTVGITTNTSDQRIIVNLLGATSSGKGFTEKQVSQFFKAAYGLIADVIGTGEAIRKKFLIDPDFKEEWEPVIQRGDPLPDRIMIPMYDELYHKGPNNGFLLINDGFLRNTNQVVHATRLGLMGKNTVSVRLQATKQTCFDRAVHRAANKIGGPRVDTKSFDKRFETDKALADDIHARILETTESSFVYVNADRDLRSVANEVLSSVGRLMELRKVELPHLGALEFPLRQPSEVPGAVLV